MSTPPDPLQFLQMAARRAARRYSPGIPAERVVVHGPGGRELVCTHVPPADPDAIDPEPGPRAGWDFEHALCRFDGTEVPIRGRSLSLLKVLAAADGPLREADLAKAWIDYEPSDKTVRGQVGELRKLLETLFPSFGEVIEAAGSGYRLLLR